MDETEQSDYKENSVYILYSSVSWLVSDRDSPNLNWVYEERAENNSW